MKRIFSLILSLVLIPTTAQANFNLSQKLLECEAHLQANRLTTGRGGTALACYEDILRQELQNAEALAGLNEIAARYERWMNRASNRGQTNRAERYQKRLSLVERVIRKWQKHEDDLQEKKPEVFVQLGHSSYVSSVAFSPDGRYIVSGSWDKTLKLWDVSTGREITTFRGHSDAVNSVAISPDGSNILSGSHDKTLKLWDLNGHEIRTFVGHSGGVESVAFNPDGSQILSGSLDGTIRLWNVETGKEIAQLISLEGGEWVRITPEGYYMASLNGAKYINVRIGNKVYGIDQYEKIYHRPDIVKLAIQLGDSQKAIARLTRPVQMAAVQPPALWFVSPQDGYETHKDSIEVQLKTENIADPAADVSYQPASFRPGEGQTRPSNFIRRKGEAVQEDDSVTGWA